MKTAAHTKIRNALRAAPDGLTTTELSVLTGVTYSTVYKALTLMPDAYIDRWQRPRRPGRMQAVWCVVEVPENCPRPTRGDQ